MKLFYTFLVILLVFFIPIPIKFRIYYSTVDYYIKLYTFTIISKNKKKTMNRSKKKNKPLLKNRYNSFLNISKNIDFKSFIHSLHTSKIKPLLRINLSCNYTLNDAAKTAVSYGIINSTIPLIYTLMSYLFYINKFNIKITPTFEDKFLLKIETSSIIFLSLANIINMIINLLKNIK